MSLVARMARGRWLVGLIATVGTLDANRADAQLSARLIDSRASNRAWLAGGVGGGSAGPAVEWEGWLAHGPLALGYYASSTDDLNKTRNRTTAVLGGIAVPYDRLTMLIQGGIGTSRRYTSNGEQSGTYTTTAVHGAPVIAVTTDVLLTRLVGLHTSYVGVLAHDIGYQTLMFGIVLGKLR